MAKGWHAGHRVLSRRFGACKLRVGNAAPQHSGFEWTVSMPHRTLAAGYAETQTAAQQKALRVAADRCGQLVGVKSRRRKGRR
jgi:hypothetical protein